MEALPITGVNGHLKVATNAFMTFLYAAAVHMILLHGVENDLVSSIRSSTVLFVIVLFFLTDWLSRTRLPALVRDPISDVAQIVKTVLDLACLYLLLVAALTYLSVVHDPLANDTRTLFLTYVAAFLATTFVWNLQMFKIMKALSWSGLLSAAIKGTALQMQATSVYGARYVAFKQGLVANVSKKEKLDPLNVVGAASVVLIGGLIPQLVAIHLSIGNLALGLVLIVHASSDSVGSLAQALPGELGHLLSSFAIWLTASLRHPTVSFFFGMGAVGVVAGVQWLRLNQFWRWLAVGAFLLWFLQQFEVTRSIGVWIGVVFVACAIPGLCFVLAEETIELAVPSGLKPALRCIGSVALIVEYLLLLVYVPVVIIPIIALVQHLSINFILQYAATPLNPPRDRVLATVSVPHDADSQHTVVVSLRKERSDVAN